MKSFSYKPIVTFASKPSNPQDFQRLEMMRDRGTTYHADGSGRDTYVEMDNGGFKKMYEAIHYGGIVGKGPGTFANKYLHRHKANPMPEMHCKPFKYPTDGSGRDYYIKSNDGGLTNHSGKQKYYVDAFKASLRSDPRNRDYLERRNYVDDCQKISQRRFS